MTISAVPTKRVVEASGGIVQGGIAAQMIICDGFVPLETEKEEKRNGAVRYSTGAFEDNR